MDRLNRIRQAAQGMGMTSGAPPGAVRAFKPLHIEMHPSPRKDFVQFCYRYYETMC